MSENEPDNGIGRRQMLRRLVAGAGATAALPALDGAGKTGAEISMPTMRMPQEISLGAAESPDPYLSDPNWKPKFFDDHENETVIVLSDVIIPDTDTPGAKAARVNRFIDLLLAASGADWRRKYLEALGWLDGYCLAKYSKPFIGLARAAQEEFLTLLTHESKDPQRDPQIVHGAELFQVLKGSIVEAYYSSEIGALQELKYQTNPFQTEFPGCRNPEEH